MMQTRALATFGVYRKAGEAEQKVLALADEYRKKLCAIRHQQYRFMVWFRNRTFPELFAALVLREACSARIYRIEEWIKAHHSDVRDRNAVTREQRAKLKAERAYRTAISKVVTRERERWISWVRAFKKFWQGLADWQRIKDRDKRRQIYARIEWPEALREYGLRWTELDLQVRTLAEEYQAKGLHSAIRAEIDDASQQKLSKDGPGMRYYCDRDPEPEPWQKLSLQFSGGITFQQLLDGKNHSLLLKEQYANVKSRGEIIERVYEVRQQLGTADHPCPVTYVMKLDKPFPADAIVQWWSLIVRKDGRRQIVPIIRSAELAKPTGTGNLKYEISWQETAQGVRIARFFGAHVNEDLVLPKSLIEKRMSTKLAQIDCDTAANIQLEKRGQSCSKPPGSLHGVYALEAYLKEHPEDTAATNALAGYWQRLNEAERITKKAIRRIKKIYETVVRRVCSQHATLTVYELDLQKLKRYDTRNLLQKDPLNQRSREILHAVAPGKLQALLKGYGLPPPPGRKATPRLPAPTDLFSSWILQLGKRTGVKQNLPCQRIRPNKKQAG